MSASYADLPRSRDRASLKVRFVWPLAGVTAPHVRENRCSEGRSQVEVPGPFTDSQVVPSRTCPLRSPVPTFRGTSTSSKRSRFPYALPTTTPDPQEASSRATLGLWLLWCVAGASVVLLVRFSGEVKIVCIHQSKAAIDLLIPNIHYRCSSLVPALTRSMTFQHTRIVICLKEFAPMSCRG